MSATLFKQVNYPLSALMHYIEIGDIGLPEIQRPFVWPNSKVRDLFDSMYKGFPVGYLLFWANGTGNGHKQIGTGAKQKVPHLLIVDGQQRLTSLFAVIKGVEVVRENYRKERIAIAFNPLSEKFEVSDAAILKAPEFIPDISLVWSTETGIFGLVDEYLARLRAVREVSASEVKTIQKVVNNLDNIQNYPFTALEISSAANEAEVAEIFVRVNSKGTSLNQADFILTLMSVFWDEGRTALESFCRSARLPSVTGPSPFNYFFQPDPDQLLRVCVGFGFRRARLNYAYLILRGKDLETEEFSEERRDQQFEILRAAQEKVLDLQNWHEFLKTLYHAGYISGSVLSSQNVILYAYVFYLIGKYNFHVDHHSLRKVISRWFFMTSLTSRYSGSFESVMEQDLNRLREVKDAKGFISILDRIISDTFTDDYWQTTLVNELDTSSARTPVLSAYYAALVLLDAPVLFSNLSVKDLLDPSTKAKKSGVERHHLFPKGYLAKNGITEIRDTNQVANFALVEWNDNIDISDAAPSEYFPEYASRYDQHEWKKLNFLHALPESWHTMSYPVFIAERRKLIAKVIKEGFKKLSV